MLTVLRSSWALMLGILLLMVGNGLQGTLLGVRGTLENIDSYWLGLIMSAYFAGFLGGARLTPLLIKRVGHVRVFAALGSLVSAAFILYSSHVDPVSWLLLRLLVGFCISGLYVVAESWINDSNTSSTRGQALSLYTIMQMSGVIIGQVLLNLADPAGYGLFILMSVLVSISFTPILLSTSPAPVFELSEPMPIRKLMKISPLGCVGSFILGGIFSALFGMASIYAAQQGMSIAQISYFSMSIFIGGLCMQFPIGWLSDRVERRLLIAIVSILATIFATYGMWISADSIWWSIGIMFFIGGTIQPLYPLLLAHANDRLSNEQMSAASGSLIMLNGVGAMGGPLVVGFLMQIAGPSGFFIFISLLAGMIALYSLYRMTQSDAISVEDALPHVILYGSSTQIVSEIAVEEVIESANQEENDAGTEEKSGENKRDKENKEEEKTST